MFKIRERANQLNITVKPEFGFRPKKTMPSAYSFLNESGNFTQFLAAVETAGMSGNLTKGLVTVLAPNDTSFEQLPPDQLQAMLADPDKVTRLVNHHILTISNSAKKIKGMAGKQYDTFAGTKIDIKVSRDDVISLSGATFVSPNNKVSTGYVHVINKVLIPPDS